MPDHPLVVNSGPIIALSHVGRLAIIEKLYSQVSVPQAVCAELEQGAHRPASNFRTDAPWITVLTPKSPPPPILPGFLGAGEIQVIQLGIEIPNALLMLDDARARHAAEALHLRTTGTAGILVRAKNEGLLDRVVPLLEQMQTSGYFFSDRVIAAARQKAGE